MDFVQKMEEMLCELAIEAHPDRKVAAEVTRDMMIQVVRAHSIEDPKRRSEVMTDILNSMSRSMGLALFLATPNENAWKMAIRILGITAIKAAKDFHKDFSEFQADRKRGNVPWQL